jgi:hypothetical protein
MSARRAACSMVAIFSLILVIFKWGFKLMLALAVIIAFANVILSYVLMSCSNRTPSYIYVTYSDITYQHSA